MNRKNDSPEELKAVIAELKSELARLKGKPEPLGAFRGDYQKLFNLLSDSVFIHDTDGNFVMVNEAACRKLGYSLEELINMRVSDIDTAKYAGKIPERMEEAVTEESIYFESEHRCKDGTVIPVELHSISFTEDAQHYILTVARDISRRLELEEQLQDRMRNQDCLLKIGRLIESRNITLNEVIFSLPDLIKRSFTHPKHISACIRLDGVQFGTVSVLEPVAEYHYAITVHAEQVGEISCYSDCECHSRGLPTDKKELIELITERLGRVIERYRSEEELREYSEKLEEMVAKRTRELEQSNRELKETIAKVKTLQGLLPICANCKKIRDDDGYWYEVSEYITDHSLAEFSHGLCPDCARKLYPDMYKDESEDE